MAEIAPQLDILGYLRAATATGTALGAQISLNAYRMQELKSQEALRRLQEQQAAQKLQFDLAQHDLMVQERADMQKAMARVTLESQPDVAVPAQGPEVAGGQQPTAFVPNPAYVPMDQSLMRNVLPVIGKYRPQEVDNFVSNVAMLPYRLAEAKRLEAQSQGGGTKPEAVTVNDPTTGKPITMVRTGPNSWSKVAESALGRALTVMETKKLLDAAPELLKRDPTTGGLVPDWSREDEIQKALSVGAGITTATRATAEKKAISVVEALAATDDAIQTIQTHPEAVGPVGVGRELVERGKGMVGISTGGAPVSKARHELELAFTRLADGLKVDTGNMSRYERSKLELVGDPSRWQESEETALNMMRNIQAALIGKQLRLHKELHTPPDDTLLRRIPASEMAGLLSDHLLDREAASRWWDLHNKR